MGYSSFGLYLGGYGAPADAELEIIKRQIACKHPGVRYLFPTDGSEPYQCVECGAKFTWDEIEAHNVRMGGKPGAFTGGSK